MNISGRFLRALYGDRAPGYLAVFTIPELDVYAFPATRLRDAGSLAERLACTTNVFFGVGLQESDPSSKRGGNDGVVALPGFWHDLDLQAPYRTRDDLPATPSEATTFVRELPVAPTAVIHSGGGLYPLWVFRELWAFGSEEERAEAARLSLGWQRFVNAAAERKGWKLDLTADLARILRLPGTLNRKGKKGTPAPVRILDSSGPRCVPSDFAEWALPEPEATTAPPTSFFESHGTRYVQVAIQRECEELAKTPEGSRNDRLNRAAFSLARFIAAGDADPAPVVRALASAAAHAGLPRREIERTLGSAFVARGVR